MSQPSESGVVPDLPIRKSREGFASEETTYRRMLLTGKNLPPGSEMLRHRVRWPVDMRNPLAHISAYFGDINYADPSDGERHLALDIQLPLGTPILAPEDATVVFVPRNNINDKRGLEDVLLYAESSGIAYWLVHLDAVTLQDRVRERRWFDKWSDVRVSAGEQIGTVGEFYNDFMRESGKPELSGRVAVPEDVQGVFSRSYNHLHFEMHFEPDINKLHFGTSKEVNPIQFLRRLY